MVSFKVQSLPLTSCNSDSMSLRLVAVPKISIGDFWSGENPRTKCRPSLGNTCATAAEFRTNAFVFGILAKALCQILSTSFSPLAVSATFRVVVAAVSAALLTIAGDTPAATEEVAGETVRAALAFAAHEEEGVFSALNVFFSAAVVLSVVRTDSSRGAPTRSV